MGALNVTKEQIENIILDTGVVYVNYGVSGERILAPTRGGNTFEVDREVKIIERDGAMGKEKGLRRVIREDATLTVRIMDMSKENLKLALPGTTLNGSKITSTIDGEILDSEYLTNITWVGTDMEGKNKVITLFNALNDEGIEINAEDKEEAVLEVAFAGHRNPSDKTEPLYSIEEVAVPGTFTITFEIDDGVADVEGAAVEFNGQVKLTNASGVAVFTAVAERDNAPVKVTKSGFVTLNTALDVTQTETINLSIVSV